MAFRPARLLAPVPRDGAVGEELRRLRLRPAVPDPGRLPETAPGRRARRGALLRRGVLDQFPPLLRVRPGGAVVPRAVRAPAPGRRPLRPVRAPAREMTGSLAAGLTAALSAAVAADGLL